MFLEVVGCQIGDLGDSSQHSRADLLIVVEGEDDIRFVSFGQGAMGAGLAFDRPATTKQRGEYPARFRRRPLLHAA